MQDLLGPAIVAVLAIAAFAYLMLMAGARRAVIEKLEEEQRAKERAEKAKAKSRAASEDVAVVGAE